MVAAGLVAGLLLAEGVFWLRDGGSFPHINFYVPDAELGARLAPDEGQKISFGGNPITSVATNAKGYRGSWPDSANVLVVGDSQVFGLGVEADQTMPAHLEQLLGTPVLNGGVPTYGPAEYLAVVEEVASTRDLHAVVFVVNYSNDLFEVGRPNRDRHVIWDGWAVRAETAPANVWNFPGRSWFFSQSHLVFALRKLWHRPSPQEALGFASEGGVADVVRVATEADHQQKQRSTEAERVRDSLDEGYQAAIEQLGDQNDLLQLYLRYSAYADGERRDLKVLAHVQQASVGDIVHDRYAESGRRITVTAEILIEGARLRRNVRNELRKLLPNVPPYDRPKISRLLRASDEIDPALAAFPIEEPEIQTPLDGTLDAFVALAKKHGFSPVVVALPLDVQVLPSQFLKYGAKPKDLSETHILFDDLAQAGRLRGVRVALPAAALAEVGDGAWLDKDLHHTSAGHAAVAKVVADTLRAPSPLPPVAAGVISSRSRVPSIEEWEAARENLVRGSTAARCTTHRIREWFRMDCRHEGERVRGFRLVDVPLETHGWYDGRGMVLIAPVLPGRSAEVDVIWASVTKRFRMEWEGDTVRMGFHPTQPVLPQEGKQLHLQAAVIEPVWANASWADVTWIGAGTHCPTTENQDADKAPVGDTDCLFGSRQRLPECPSGFDNAGSAGHCFASCSDELACTTGTCSAWGRGSICL